MLKIETDGERMHCQHCGDPVTIAVELSIAAGDIFNAFKSRSVAAAEVFRSALLAALEKDSPSWQQDEGFTSVMIQGIKKGDAPTGQSQGTADK